MKVWGGILRGLTVSSMAMRRMKNWDSKKDKCDEMRRAEVGGAWAGLQDQSPLPLIPVCDLWKGSRPRQAGASRLLVKAAGPEFQSQVMLASPGLPFESRNAHRDVMTSAVT